MAKMEPTVNDRFCYAKDYRRPNGQWAWGVFDNTTKKFIERGFFQKDAARQAAAQMNAEQGGR